MHKLYVFALIVTTVTASFLVSQYSYAINANVVISQIQLGDSVSANNEFIEIKNNTATDIEITDWCLYYASANSTQFGSKLTCFTTDNDNIHLNLPAYSSLFAISNQLFTAMTNLGSDFKFAATLSGMAGHVRLVNQNGIEVDKVGWGKTAISAEGFNPATLPTVGNILRRKIITTNIYQDTDINNDDFEVAPPDKVYPYESIYEVQDICSNLDGTQMVLPDGYSVDTFGKCSPPPIDICDNLDGLQIVVPAGYLLDEKGHCQFDICLNIDGLQLILPDGMEFDATSNCVRHDECSNLSGIQTNIPYRYKRGFDNSCMLDLLPLSITELFPNAVGGDDGNEFIEIYNPNTNDVNLNNYLLSVGLDNLHVFHFPDGSHIAPGQYIAFSNDDIKFTLINTTSDVGLISSDGVLIDKTQAYVNPDDGMSWALIDGVWGYTNRPTPGDINVPSVLEAKVIEAVVDSSIEPCGSNQYRNPDTNRCKLIPETNSTITPCKDGQYRSEETNRCRNIVSDVIALTQCAEGQERNPDTNRCRSVTAVLGSADLAPCKTGQERNPDTNRCRNIVSSIPQAEYVPEQTFEKSNNYLVWWVLAGIGSVAVAYAVWEWRQEIIKLTRKLISLLHFNK